MDVYSIPCNGCTMAVLFPLDMQISLLVSSDGKPQVEMATVGKEGIVGASELVQRQGRWGEITSGITRA